MDSTLFKNPSIYARCLNSLDEEIHRTKEEFIINHLAKYSEPIYPPVWKTLEVASFGTLSKMFSNFSDNSVKKDVARGLGLPQHVFLESWMTSIAGIVVPITPGLGIVHLLSNLNFRPHYQEIGYQIEQCLLIRFILCYVVSNIY